ncbi:sulfotransferase [Elongatibacter sediminis]|uniref:Sulfotransferase n=1 Tax=Elongatibacter sediminis TaxID=3119006 RepID=A0AAW9RAM1_9GAMM
MTTTNSESMGNLQTALRHAAALLKNNPGLAERQAREILAVQPGADPAIRILAAALRMQGNVRASRDLLEPLATRYADSPSFLLEWGLVLGALGEAGPATAALRKSVRLQPEQAAAWRALGDQLALAGDEEGSRAAYERQFAAAARHPDLVRAADEVRDGRYARAEGLLREYLKQHPADVSALRMLADVGMKLGQFDDARALLEQCLELAPDFHLARHNYAVVLVRQNRLDEACEQVRRLLARDSANPNFLILMGTIRVRRGEHAEALEIYERVLKDYPNQARAQMNYGHTLKTVGRVEESIAAYRNCIRINPAIGEAYWSLANLKTYRFTDEEIELMRGQVTTEGGDPDDQAHLAFALGKALEDRGEYDEAFRYYHRGNAIRRVNHRHDMRVNVFNTARQIKTLTADFFAERDGWGCPAEDPIFIVGLPRAGSTLLEQILASHSQVEGTAELVDIIQTARKLGARSRRNPASNYPEVLADLTAEQCRELGERYLETTRVQRTDTPFFIDKMPNNFQHVGLIHLILPRARVIDARRHPMACCFSGFKQLFARGQTFTYGLEEIGKYYRDYVILMDHWDEVLPGRVWRVQYEDMVADTENRIRELLEYCRLPFEEQCLRFWETERAVRTPSAEQVRQPIYTAGLEQWRHFEHHLDPLKKALGPVLERYPVAGPDADVQSSR